MTRPLLALALLAVAGGARAEVTLVGVGLVPGTTADKSGLTGTAPDGTPNDRLGGVGSAIAYAGRGDEYVLASDSGPKGHADYPCRVHRVAVRVTPGAKRPVAVELLSTTLLTSERGERFTGAPGAFLHRDPDRNLRLDPEGVRVGRGGELFVSDEYGPVVYQFDAAGKRVRALPVPAKFRVAKPNKSPAAELPPHNTAGRVPNRGMEGLAITPDGAKLLGAMQGPLIQDGALDAKGGHAGVNCRLLEIDIVSGKTREFVYRLDGPVHGVSEVVAVNDREFLVLERDGKGGTDAAFKRVFKIDLSGATDVSGVAALPAGGLPAGVVPVTKAPFLDLLAPQHGVRGAKCPGKFEGLAFGPDLPDGRRLLLVTADNDFRADEPFRVYAFAVDRADLPGYRAQEFAPRP